MADRLNYYFRQKVTEAELDLGFEALENADRNMILDLGQVGIVKGMAVTQRGAGANLSVDVGAGVVYDKLGQRIQFSSTQNVDVSVDENNVSTSVAGAGNQKKISVFVKFRRVLTDPRTDGNSATVYFSEAEGFEFIVRQSAEGVAPSPSAIDTEAILLCDITRAFGQTTIVNANIDTSTSGARREDALKYVGATHTLRRGQLLDAFKDVVDWIGVADNALIAHLNDTIDAHDASAISYLGSPNWADATAVTSNNVEAALDEIVSDLAANTGSARIGHTGGAGVFVSLSTGGLATAIGQLHTYVDGGPLGRTHNTYTVANNNLLLTTQKQISVNTSGGAFTLQLPTPTAGRELYFKDVSGTWGTNPLTLKRNGTEMIEGVAADRPFGADYGAFRLYADGTNWWIG